MDNFAQAPRNKKLIRSAQASHAPRSPKRWINHLVIFLLRGIRPILGPASCRYALTCGNYAVYQLEHQPLCYALFLIVKRVLSCNPLGFVKKN